jgi:Helicase associated domain
MFGRLLEFRKYYQHCRVPPSYGDGTLATWCEKIRAKKKAGILKRERELALDEVGFDWDPKENRRQDLYARLVRYREVHGHCCPPRSYEDKKLVQWVFEQRTKHKSGKLSDERKRMLDEIEFVFDVREASWLEHYQQLKSFFEQHGHSDVPQSDKELGVWLAVQRRTYREGKLEKRKVEMLNKLAISWDPHEDAWNVMFTKLQKIKESSGSLITNLDPESSRWLRKQRKKYGSGKLEKDKIEKLESIGISWNPDEDFWSSMYGKLTSRVDSSGRCHVPYDHPDKQLFNFAVNQRALKRRGLLRLDRIKMLDAIKFDWSPTDRRQPLRG